jgi:hypothetical protein
MRDLLQRCLDRNVKKRLQHIGETRIALENYREAPRQTAALAAPALWGFLRNPSPPEQPVVRVSTPLTEFTYNSIGATISADGKYLAYI